MYLQKLEIQGFKSFADKKVFSFPKKLTVIVGPNGSGKSNVADAIRWVLGEQSNKVLRGKKAADMIYHGSYKRSRVGMAQVDLYLNNDDKRIPLEYSEIVISRRLYRDGESEYLLNKNKVTLQEIIMLLAKANFGQKSYAVIGQGTVETILNAAPQNRKEYFDEAAGVKQFQIKRDQALNKLLRTEENLQQTGALVNEIEPRLHSLERQVKKLEKRESLEKELHEIQIIYYGQHWQQMSSEYSVLQQSFSQATNEKIDFDKKLKEVSEKIDVLGKEKTRAEHYNTLQSHSTTLQSKKNELIKRQTVLQGRMEVDRESQGQMNIVWLQQKRSEIKKEVLEKQNHISTIHNSIVRLEKQLNTKSGDQKEIMKEFQSIEYKLLKAKEELHQGTTVTLPQVKQDLMKLYHLQEDFLQKLLHTKDLETFNNIKKEAKSLALRFAELVDKFNDDQGEIKAKQVVEQLQTKFDNFLQTKDTLVNEVHEIRIKVETQKAELNMMQKSFEQQQAEYQKIEKEVDHAEKLANKDDKASRISEYRKEFAEVQKAIDSLDAEIAKAQKAMDEFNAKEQEKKDVMMELQHKARDLQKKLDEIHAELQDAKIQLTRVETRKEDMQLEMQRELNEDLIQKVKKYKETGADLRELEGRIARIKHQLELIGGIDPETVKEHKETKERFEFLTTHSTDLNETMKKLEVVIDELDTTIKKQFEKSFKHINEHFGKYFKILFGGGQAQLKLVTEETSEEPSFAKASEGREANQEGLTEAEQVMVEQEQDDVKKEHTSLVKSLMKKQKKIISGVEIIAMPPTKKTRNVQALSGGEKALTALALLSAILETNPAPFVVLDEVEAALDESNSEKFSAILERLSQSTQFIVITHNRVTMHHADVLYGVTMADEGASKILSLKLEEAEHLEASGKVKTM